MLEEHGLEEGSTAFISSTKLDAVADHLLSLAKCVPHSLSARILTRHLVCSWGASLRWQAQHCSPGPAHPSGSPAFGVSV